MLNIESKPKLNTFVYYAKVEMIPPTPAEFPQVAKGFGNLIKGFKTSSWRNLTVKEAWLNTLITVEVMCWFFVGEIIGKRKLVGYDV
jgi:F-type H+-transporting ATPase subunit g